MTPTRRSPMRRLTAFQHVAGAETVVDVGDFDHGPHDCRASSRFRKARGGPAAQAGRPARITIGAFNRLMPHALRAETSALTNPWPEPLNVLSRYS